MSHFLTNSLYHIIETPIITDISYLYTYNLNSNNAKKVNNLNYNIYETSRNTIYYDDILMYNPDPLNNPYQGIQSSQSIGTYNVKIRVNIFDLSKYISNKLVNFINEMQLVNRCNKYGLTTEAIPAECSNTFIGYDSKNNINTQMINTQNSKLPAYNPSLLSNQKKHLQQQLNDIKNLIDRFNEILVNVKNNNEIPSVNYKQLIETNNQLKILRSDLDDKLGEIYEYDNSKIVQSRNKLDNTVYSGVLWSILATSLAYFIFVKL